MKKEKTDLRVIKTKQNIKHAVITLLGQKKASEITITEVAEKAMVNRKTFYAHYSSVDAVIADIEQNILENFIHVMKNDRVDLKNLRAVLIHLGAMIKLYQEPLSRMLKLSPNLFHFGRIKEMLRVATQSNLRNMMTEENDTIISITSEFIVSGVLSCFSNWLENGCQEKISKIVDIQIRLISGALESFLPPGLIDRIQ